MKNSRKRQGKMGEDIAASRLTKQGFTIIKRNFTSEKGEIDIIAQKNKALFFVEVKTIAESDPFLPEDHLTPSKKKQLVRMARDYMDKNNIPSNTEAQIDLVAVEIVKGGDYKIRRYKNISEDNSV